jgi:hypothetical protein
VRIVPLTLRMQPFVVVFPFGGFVFAE